MTRPDAPTAAFLTARWNHLVMLNFEVAPQVLLPYLPGGVELDTWGGRHLVSVVGFRFLSTRLLGVPVPFHRDFDEINLRFYVRRDAPDGPRRGVVFVQEIVPRPALAAVARLAYGERYVSRPMRHGINLAGSVSGTSVPDGVVRYAWEDSGTWHGVRATTTGSAAQPDPGSQEEFVTEHYWGYAAQRDGSTMEYQVTHPRWNTWPAADAVLECDVESVYGAAFAPWLSAEPVSAFVADGSAVTVHRPTRLRARPADGTLSATPGPATSVLGPDWRTAPDGVRERDAARVILLDDAGRALLVRGHDVDQPGRSWWFTLGGGIDPGESSVDAALREVREEAGLVLTARDLTGPVLTRTGIFDFFAETCRQHEVFYLAHVPAGQRLDRSGWTDVERATLDEMAWLSAADLRAQQREVFPAQLADIIEDLATGWSGSPRHLGPQSD